MSIWIIGHILALCIGLSLGLIGGGGSIMAVPILVYVLGLEAKVAIAMSLAIVGVVSLIGVIPHWQRGNVNLKTAVSFTPPAMLGAFLGARLAASKSSCAFVKLARAFLRESCSRNISRFKLASLFAT